MGKAEGGIQQRRGRLGGGKAGNHGGSFHRSQGGHTRNKEERRRCAQDASRQDEDLRTSTMWCEQKLHEAEGLMASSVKATLAPPDRRGSVMRWRCGGGE